MHFFRINILALLFLLPTFGNGQQSIVIDKNFKKEIITPNAYRDPSNDKTFDHVSQAYFQQFFKNLGTPYFTLGTEPSNLWLKIQVKNELDRPRTLVLRLNRKNFDEFTLWQKDSLNAGKLLGSVGVKQPPRPEFNLLDGYYYAVTFLPGTTDLYALTYNRAGAMYIGLSLHTPEQFAITSRENVVSFGVFLGIMSVAIVFSLLLFAQTREAIYLFYLLYVFNILLRESHQFTADFGLLPAFQRHAASLLLAATFGTFYRHFMDLKKLAPVVDTLIKGYVWAVCAASAVMTAFTVWENHAAIKWIYNFFNGGHLVFTFVLLGTSTALIKKTERAWVTFLAFLPLATAFVLTLLRNMDYIGNYPFIQHAVMWGFVVEVLILTAAFSIWLRNVESERKVLQLTLERETIEKQLAVQTAEQKVKDRIARDLHDDVAATISGIRIMSQVAKNQISGGGNFPNSETGSLLEQISKSAQSAVETIGDLIWAVKPQPDYLNDIADRIREYASKVLEIKDIDYKINIPRNLPMRELDIQTKRNIYLIFKESLNNSLKYSDCSKVEISLNFDNNLLNLEVADNGIGFDNDSIRSGNGLNNMRKRASEIGGHFGIETSPQMGTLVRFSLRMLPAPSLN